MTAYTIQESPLGTYALLLGTQLIMQASNREDCERVMTALENSTHAQRVLRAVHYDRDSNEIRDGIEPR